MVEHQVLPLAHVAKVVIVEKDYLDWRLLLHDSAKFLYAHLETAVAGEQHHLPVGRAKRGAYCSRKTKAHGAEAAAADDAAVFLVLEISA